MAHYEIREAAAHEKERSALEATVNESRESSGARPRHAPCERVRHDREENDFVHQEGADEEEEADLEELWETDDFWDDEEEDD